MLLFFQANKQRAFVVTTCPADVNAFRCKYTRADLRHTRLQVSLKHDDDDRGFPSLFAGRSGTDFFFFFFFWRLWALKEFSSDCDYASILSVHARGISLEDWFIQTSSKILNESRMECSRSMNASVAPPTGINAYYSRSEQSLQLQRHEPRDRSVCARAREKSSEIDTVTLTAAARVSDVCEVWKNASVLTEEPQVLLNFTPVHSCIQPEGIVGLHDTQEHLELSERQMHIWPLQEHICVCRLFSLWCRRWAWCKSLMKRVWEHQLFLHQKHSLPLTDTTDYPINPSRRESSPVPK